MTPSDASGAVAAALTGGLVLGLGGGLSPGPLLTLVVSESLRSGVRAGIAVACAPLITDAPIIALALVAVDHLEGDPRWIAGLSLAGAAVVAWLGWEAAFRARPPELAPEAAAPSLWRGVVANLVNPNPWLFWGTVGAASLLRARAVGWGVVVSFLASFYLGLVGSKVVVAVIAGRAGRRISGKAFVAVQRVLGVALWLFAAWLAVDGVHRLVG